MADTGSKAAGERRSMKGIIAVIVVVVIVIAAVGIYALVSTKKAHVTDVYFYNWWATEGKIALQKEAASFHSAYPSYAEVSELKAGAGGTAAKGAILSLIKAGTPPNTFQTHFGPEMISYIEAAPNGASSFTDMTPVAQSMGLTSSAVPSVLLAGTFNGTMFSLPVDTHRGAQLYFNPQLLRAHNLPIPTTLTQLINDSVALHNDGVTAWMIPGNDGGWDQLNVWEDIFLSLAGPTMYDELMYGTINMSSPAVQSYISQTNSIFLQFEGYNYAGASTMTWTQGIPKIVGQDAGFQVNGNWYVNYAYDYLNVTTYPAIAPYTSWTNISLMAEPFPGTSSLYALVIDSVAVPAGPTAAAGLVFAKYFASFQGQMVFTKWKAVTFYNNITNDYFNTPDQWYDYQSLLHTAPTNFVYQLSDGGLFDDVFATLDSGLTALSQSGPSGLASWNSTLMSGIATEKAEWLTANSLGYGFMGTPLSPFGGYMPPWVKVSSAASHTAGKTQVHASKPVLVYVPPLSYLSNMKIAALFVYPARFR